MRQELPDLLQGWDYASTEIVGLDVSIHEEEFLSSTGLDTLAQVELLLLADCKSTQNRIVARYRLGREPVNKHPFEIELPAGELAGTLTLHAILTLGCSRPHSKDRSAYLRGARLASSDPQTVVLEGEASRFPVEPAAFSELHLPAAPWTLLLTHEDMDASFMGGVRLLVNTEHAAGQKLLDSSTSHLVAGLATADILRLLIATSAEHADEIRAGDFEEESVAFVIDNMCEFYLGRNLQSAIQLYETDPLEFDRIVHERLQPLSKVIQ